MEFNGATVWLRQTIESDIFYWKPDKWFKIWFFLVNKVNHKDTKLFPRGSNFTTYQEITQFTGASKNQIDQFIRWSKKEQMLTTQKTTRGMIIKVLKYAEFQDYIKSKNDTKNEIETKHKRNINDTINKNGNNDNKINTIKLGCQNDNHLAPQVRLGKDRLIIVPNGTSIIINKTKYMLEELTYEPLEEKQGKTKYGRATMAILARKYAELAGIELGKCFDASEWSKPLGSMYRYFGKDADKTMAYMEKAIKYFESKKLTYTPHTLARNKEMMNKWAGEDKYDPRYE